MAPPRNNRNTRPNPQGEPNGPRATAPQSSFICSAIIVLLVGWTIVWLAQHFYNGASGQSFKRWQFFFSVLFVPDEIFSTWASRPITLDSLWDRLFIVSIVGLIVAPPSLLSWMAIGRIEPLRSCRPLERLCLSVLSGLALHATITLVVGIMGLISTPACMPIVCGLELLAAIWFWKTNRLDPLPPRPKRWQLPRSAVLPALIAGIAMGFVLLRCFMPSGEFDVLEYHLGAPKEWFLNGQITFLPHNIYANMPLAVEMQSLCAMSWCKALGIQDPWWWGGVSGTALNYVYWLATLGVTFCTTRRVIGGTGAWWLLAATSSCLPLAQVTVLGLVETAVAAHFGAALLVLVICRKRFGESCWPALIVGLFCGAAFACKYPSLVFICIPMLIAMVSISLRCASRKTQLLSIGTFTLGVCLTAGPWLLKNLIQTGNPVYPLAASIFGGATLTDEKIAQWNAAHAVPSIGADELLSSLQRFAWSWDAQGTVILPLMLLGLFSVRRSMMAMILSGIALYGIAIWWLLTHHLFRFLLPLSPIVFVLAGFGIRMFFVRCGKTLASTVLIGCIGLNVILLAGSPALGDPRLLVALREIRGENMGLYEFGRVPQHVVWINEQFGQQTSKILLLGDAGIFDYEMPVLYSTCFDESPLAQAIIGVAESEQHQALVGLGATHIVVHWGEIDRYRMPGGYGFDSRITPELFDDLCDRKLLERYHCPLEQTVMQVFQVLPVEQD